jgi:hypothetical protein
MRTALVPALLLGLGSGCASQVPRIPFRDTAFQASAVGGYWVVNQFVDDANVYALELVLEEAGTAGWGLEFGARYAEGEGDGTVGVPNSPNPNVIVDSTREIDFYEVSFGVRQTYRHDERLQPYFGVGGALIQARSVERFLLPGPPPTPASDHERTEIRPGIYGRVGLVWNLLRDQVREESEFPLSFDVRGLLSVDYSYLELTLGFGFGR